MSETDDKRRALILDNLSRSGMANQGALLLAALECPSGPPAALQHVAGPPEVPTPERTRALASVIAFNRAFAMKDDDAHTDHR